MSDLAVDVAVTQGEFSLDAAFTAPAGRTLVVVGPNGAGKTTLLGAIAGLVPLARGRITLGDVVLDDVEARQHVPPRRRGCGVVFQDVRLFPTLDVVGNVTFGLRARGVPRRLAVARAHRALDDVGLGAFAARRIDQLSGGEAQRVALARVLVTDPHVLLLDEALSSLDVEARAGTRALLRRALSGLAGPRVVVTHDPVEALSLADLLAVVEAGSVVWSGSPTQLQAAPPTPFVAAIAGLNVVSGTLRRRGADAWVETPTGRLYTVDDVLADGASVMAVIDPAAVVLSAAAPSGSARNVLPVTVSDVRPHGGRARILLDGRPPLRADVTAASVESLHLRAGVALFASVKATEVRIQPA